MFSYWLKQIKLFLVAFPRKLSGMFFLKNRIRLAGNEHYFKTKLTRDQKNLYLNLLNDFLALTHVEYALSYGSLVGALLYKGFIPWHDYDDDIDIFCHYASYEAVQSICQNNQHLACVDIKMPGGGLLTKIFYKNRPGIIYNSDGTTWPAIDIAWLEPQGKGTIKDLSNSMVYKASAIFPSKKILFENQSYSVPNQAQQIILEYYPWAFKYALTHSFCHRSGESYSRRLLVPLEELEWLYPVLKERNWLCPTECPTVESEVLFFPKTVIS